MLWRSKRENGKKQFRAGWIKARAKAISKTYKKKWDKLK